MAIIFASWALTPNVIGLASSCFPADRRHFAGQKSVLVSLPSAFRFRRTIMSRRGKLFETDGQLFEPACGGLVDRFRFRTAVGRNARQDLQPCIDRTYRIDMKPALGHRVDYV